MMRGGWNKPKCNLRIIAWCMQRKTYCPDNFGKTFVNSFLSLMHAHIHICTNINNHESETASHMWEWTSNLQRIRSSIIFFKFSTFELERLLLPLLSFLLMGLNYDVTIIMIFRTLAFPLSLLDLSFSIHFTNILRHLSGWTFHYGLPIMN